MSRVTASVVVYNSSFEEMRSLFCSLAASELISKWVVVDNAADDGASAAEKLRSGVEDLGGRYVASPGNIGFGAGHNLAMRKLTDTPSEFHLVVNPDISFRPPIIEAMLRKLDERKSVVWLMPRVLYPDGSEQYLCKLLPTPLNFALRRFLPTPLQALLQTLMSPYELRGLQHTETKSIPFLSGCFIMTRRSALEEIGGFDQRYFLYMEDVDLCRRMSTQGDLLYWPEVVVTHGFHRGSHHSLRLTMAHLHSSALYFCRWGWIFDASRKTANRHALAELRREVGERKAATARAAPTN